MSTQTQSSGHKLELSTIQFSRDQKGALIRIPSGPDLEGYLVFLPEENNYAQVRLLKTSDLEKRRAFQTVTKRVLQNNDSVICPEMFAQGEGDSALFYVSSLPRGEQVTRFVKRNGPIPPSNAVGLVLRFLKGLRTQNPALYEDFAMSPESIWIARTSRQPRIMLGEFCPVIDPDPEQRNLLIGLELLRYLTGEAPFDLPFQELCKVIQSDRKDLKTLIEHLDLFAKENPPTEFWTEKTRPDSLLEELSARAEPVTKLSDDQRIPEKTKTRFSVPVLLPTAALILAFGGLLIGLKSRSLSTLASASEGNSIVKKDGGTPGVSENRLPSEGVLETKTTLGSAAIPTVDPVQKADRKIELLESLAMAARKDDDLFEAIQLEMALHDLKPDWNEPRVRIRDDLADLQLKASRPLKAEEISILEKVAPVDARAFDMLIRYYQGRANVEGEIKTLVNYGRQGHPAKLREAGKRIMGTQSATVSEKTKARSWLLEAADAGDREAQFHAGESFIVGNGEKKDFNKGVNFLSRAAEQGDANALNLLGLCYVEGWGVTRDDKKAFKLLAKSVQLGNISACYHLGARYAEGKGVPRNPDKAADLFELGSGKGEARSMFVYARCFENGYGREENRVEAIKWFRKSAEKGNPDAIQWCKKHEIEFRDASTDLSVKGEN